MRSLPQIDYRDYRTTALRSLVHCVDRNEDRGITDRRRSDTTNRTLSMTVMMHIGIVERDLAATPKTAMPIRFTLNKAVYEAASEILGPGTLR